MTGYGPVIRRLRGERGWSQVALSTAAGVSTCTVQDVERGRVTPSRATVCAIAYALGAPPLAVIEEAGIPPREPGGSPRPDRDDIAVPTTYSIPIGLRDAVRVVAACHGVTPSAWVQEALRERLGRG